MPKNRTLSHARSIMLMLGLCLGISMQALANDWPEAIDGSSGENAYSDAEHFITTRYDALDAEMSNAMDVVGKDGRVDVLALNAALHRVTSGQSSDHTYNAVMEWLEENPRAADLDEDQRDAIEKLVANRKENHEDDGERLVAALMRKMKDTSPAEQPQAQAWLSVFALFAVDFSKQMEKLPEQAAHEAVAAIRAETPTEVMHAARSGREGPERERAFLEIMQVSASGSQAVCLHVATRTIPGGREDSEHLRGMIAEHCNIIFAKIAVGDMPQAMKDLYYAAGWEETMEPVTEHWYARTNH